MESSNKNIDQYNTIHSITPEELENPEKSNTIKYLQYLSIIFSILFSIAWIYFFLLTPKEKLIETRIITPAIVPTLSREVENNIATYNETISSNNQILNTNDYSLTQNKPLTKQNTLTWSYPNANCTPSNNEMANEYKAFMLQYTMNVDIPLKSFYKTEVFINNTIDPTLIQITKIFDSYYKEYQKMPETFKRDLVIQFIREYYQNYNWSEQSLINLANTENITFLKDYFLKVINLSDNDIAYLDYQHELHFSNDTWNNTIYLAINNMGYPDDDAISIYNKKWVLLKASDFIIQATINEWTITATTRSDNQYADIMPQFNQRGLNYSPQITLSLKSKITGGIFVKKFVVKFYDEVSLSTLVISAWSKRIPMFPWIEWAVYNGKIFTDTKVKTIAFPLWRFFFTILVPTENSLERIPWAPVTTFYENGDPSLCGFQTWEELKDFNFINYFF